MTTTKCKTIRQEIDDGDIDQQLTLAATEHLSGCSDCRTFQGERRALQGLISSLDTVGAPSDFDFRLRARLARDKSRDRGGIIASLSRPIAAVAMVLLILVGGILFKNWREGRAARTSPVVTKIVTDNGTHANESTRAPAATPSVSPSGGQDQDSDQGHLVAGIGTPQEKRKKNRAPVAASTNNTSMSNGRLAKNASQSAIRDSGLSPAPMLLSDTKPGGSPILVQLDRRAMRISVNNGSGTSRTISLPTVSFGSQRLVARQSFQAPGTAPNGVW